MVHPRSTASHSPKRLEAHGPVRPQFLRGLSWSRWEPVSARTTARSHEAWPCYRFGSYRNRF